MQDMGRGTANHYRLPPSNNVEVEQFHRIFKGPINVYQQI